MANPDILLRSILGDSESREQQLLVSRDFEVGARFLLQKYGSGVTTFKFDWKTGWPKFPTDQPSRTPTLAFPNGEAFIEGRFGQNPRDSGTTHSKELSLVVSESDNKGDKTRITLRFLKGEPDVDHSSSVSQMSYSLILMGEMASRYEAEKITANPTGYFDQNYNAGPGIIDDPNPWEKGALAKYKKI